MTKLTVSTGSAYRKTINSDAQAIADGIARTARQAVAATMADTASIRDAKFRRKLAGKFADAVLDALAGDALASLAKQAESTDLAANRARPVALEANPFDLPVD